MALRAGTNLGLYEIIALVGVGGMGEVYRARDTKLDREVAIKILPETVARDPERLVRFQREARMLAALNHPYIATIHGMEQSGDLHYLVMEMVPGDTLSELIARGQIPLSQAVKISGQIAEALEAAHGKGIVHRDLKPANIKVTPEGRTKVLDFGLAKAFEPGKPAADASRDDTLTVNNDPTRAGQILGTPAYMGPEQVRGLPLDQRADIWSFGCVVFELLSGRPPFRGQTMNDTFANILQRDPDWQALPASTPEHIRAVLRKCFEKDVTKRLSDIGTARRELESTPGKVAASEPRSKSAFSRIAAIAGVAIIALVTLGLGFNLGGVRNRLMAIASPSPIRAIAVLPLENQSNDPGQQYFADGFTDALITDLSKLQALKVISRTSAMRYKSTKKATREIASELGVDAVVEGAVLTEDGKVRITVNLVRADTDKNLWTESYVRDLKDVLTLQGDVARVIAGQIQLALTPDEQTRLAGRAVDPDVYKMYLKAQFKFDQDDVPSRREAIQLFKEVTEKDPNYAPGWAGLALANASLGRFYEEPRIVMPRAREAARMAIKLDDTLSEAYTALATVKLQFDWDWDGANEDLQRAIKLNRSSADAHDLYAAYYTVLGDFERARSEIELARDVDPLSLRFADRYLYILVFFRHYDETISEAQKILAKDPNFAMGYAWEGMAYTMQRRFPEALATIDKAYALDPNPGTKIFMAVVKGSAGKKDEAEKLVHEIEALAKQQYICNYEISQVYAAMGDNKQAYKWLNSGVQQQCDCMVWLQGEPWMDPIRTDRQYQDLIQRVGLNRLPSAAH